MKTSKLLFTVFAAGMLSCLTTACNNSNSKEEMEQYYNEVVKEISSEQYWGRSIYNDGAFKTADYIIDRLKSFGIAPCSYNTPQDTLAEVVGIFGPVGAVPKEIYDTIFPVTDPETDRYFQKFAFNMNVMHNNAIFKVDGQEWKPTVDYVFKEFSPTCEIKGEIVNFDDRDIYSKEKFVKTLNSGAYKDKFVLLDYDRFIEVFGADGQEPYKAAILPLTKVGGVIFEYDHRPGFFKSRSSYNTPCPVVAVQKPFPRIAGNAYVKIDAAMHTYAGRNIIAEIPGTEITDKYNVIFAHYDHLGVMGKDNVFYGANDNASGVAMVLSLAKYYSQPHNRPKQSILFIFWDAEEANLLGSWYYTANPIFPLENISFIADFDMIGDAALSHEEEVLHVQVSTGAVPYYESLKKMNTNHQWFKEIVLEDLCDDSDNYPFDIKGVPAIYFSIDGQYYKHYHSPRDCYDNSSSANFSSLFEFCTKTIK